MKKLVSMLLSAAMIFTMTSGFVFAADDSSADNSSADAAATAEDSAPTTGADASADTSATNTTQPALTDITGTAYETAVSTLVGKNVITGYEDNTYRPAANITRAEACALIYRAFAHTDIGFVNPEKWFSDLSGSEWAADYIAYCSDNKIVVGYGDGTFHPTANVTNYELITMLVRAKGLADDAAMAWPSDYVAVADSTGITASLQGITLSADGNSAATRGNSAIMIYNAGDFAASEPGSGTTENPGTSTETPGSSEKPGESGGTTDTQTNALSDYSGKAYGMITNTGHALDDKGNTCSTAEFQMGDETYNILAKSSAASDLFQSFSAKSGLVMITMSSGRATAVKAIDSTVTNTNGLVLMTGTTAGAFYRVIDANKTYLYYADDTADTTTEDGVYVGINNPVIVYVCEPDGSTVKYTRGSMSDVSKGCYAAAYSIDKDSQGIADVVVVIDADDVDELLDSELVGPTIK